MKIETHKPDSTGAGYYVAELVKLDTKNDPWGRTWYPEIDAWCTDTFGQEDVWGEEPITGWKCMRNKYFFIKEDQLSWFLIRWL